MIHHPTDANGSPVPDVITNTTDPASESARLRTLADIEREPEFVAPDYEAEREKLVNATVDFIASMCTDPNEVGICRRAAMNIYRMGRLHEAIEIATAKAGAK